MLTRILAIIVSRDPQLKELLLSVDEYFLQSLRGTDMRLRKENVERFLRIGSVGQLISVCSANANGLNSILGPSLVCSLDNNDSNGQGAVESNVAEQSTTAPAGTNDDDDAVYNIQELLGPGRGLAAALGVPMRRLFTTGLTAFTYAADDAGEE